MKHSTILLAHLLNCGYRDITLFEKELDNFKVDIEDLDIEDDERPTLNDLLYRLYDTVVRRHNIDEERVSIFTNCMDSHLNIDNNEMYTEQDVINMKVEEPEEETGD